MRNKRILVAALNWGLGHATRCIPIIKELVANGYEPIIASDGKALKLLKKEFPHYQAIELPSYNITYSRKGSDLKWKLARQAPGILKTIQEERRLTERLVEQFELFGIISDNRWGVRSDKIKKNVFITHQMNVLSGKITFLSSYIQQRYIQKFDQCWIPDFEDETNLSGKLGHLNNTPENVKYIGTLSRFQKNECPIIYDYLVLLSGPEPQRSILESKLLKEFGRTDLKILFIRGIISEEKIPNALAHISIKNYLYGELLENAINSSEMVIARSGYTTLMDLSKLEKKAFFIPTPGQKEQEYLAKRLEELKYAPYCEQENFTITQIKKSGKYKGLSNFGDHSLLRDRLAFFERE
ncbi:glycosyltransferase [Gramella lutea]|uniref:Glycosyltransferase n=1 Tax=Christiangramia lutea TaxID=1607951 RepID=A0A9X2AAE6_9FLAO|nr:glycosyltransferase [Christiangramia lutea]MCH4822013.1 glycosyltransferase [Christiangramia lutea]